MKSADTQFIKIRGARVHNLKNISLDIPKNKLVVITGLSGSGKSSLAFDTIYAEAERRFVESLSSYARQFLGVKDKPEVESIEGLSPAISIDQKSISRNPRSTVGTITEIYDYLRILFARIGKPHCPQCGRPVGRQTVDQIVDAVSKIKGEVLILAPLVSGKKGEHRTILEEVKRGGFVRVRIDGKIILIDEALRPASPAKRGEQAPLNSENLMGQAQRISFLDKKKKHSIEVVVDRFKSSDDVERSRVRDSVETALKIGKGLMIANIHESNRESHKSPHSLRESEISEIRGSSVRIRDITFSEKLACTECGINLPDIEPRTFSFNSPYGACPACTGLGSTLEVDPELVLPNKRLSIAEGAIRPWASASHRLGRQSWYWWILSDLAERYHFSLNVPVERLPQRIIELILYGEDSAKSENQESTPDLIGGKNQGNGTEGSFEGVIPNLKRRWKETDSEFTRAEIEKYMMIRVCPECRGRRLRPEALAVKIGESNFADLRGLKKSRTDAESRTADKRGQGKSRTDAEMDIASLTAKTIEEAERFFLNLLKKLKANELKIATPLVKEIIKRLKFLEDVGLEYLTLNRESTTLSGGEAQRIQLATQIGSRLTGIIYILDEPSIGLHPRDHARLIKTLKDLRDLGNTVIVVEHDAQTMREADWVIDLGPGAGRHGGRVIFEGGPKSLLSARTLTGDYLSGRKKVLVMTRQIPNLPRTELGVLVRGPKSQIPNKFKIQSPIKSGTKSQTLLIRGASEHNLKNIDVKIPLGKFVCVSGVSGSGKSTLVNDILAKALLAQFHHAHLFPGKHESISGTENINKAVVVDQSPIGRTPRSNPATYTGAFGPMRSIFARTIEARARGYDPGRFSFNVKGGRCEICEGQGVKKIEMYFLPDVYVECEECDGLRYNREALEIEYNGKNIAEVLDMSVEEALEFFKAIPAIHSKLETLYQVGLGYIKLGQPAPTLSGGEAQRVKLATELSRRDTGRTLYILDEPTTGLHFDDTLKLLKVLRALVDKGNTVLLIEHNPDIWRNADWIIDLGPEGGEKGGRIVAEGTPRDIIRMKQSYTGQWLNKTL